MSTTLYERKNQDGTAITLVRYGAGLGTCGVRLEIIAKAEDTDKLTQVSYSIEPYQLGKIFESLMYGFPALVYSTAKKAREKSWWARCFIKGIQKDLQKNPQTENS